MLNWRDITFLAKLALGLSLLAFVASFEIVRDVDGACRYVDYGAIVFGGLGALLGSIGEARALRASRGRVENLAVSGLAVALGILNVLKGAGLLWATC